MIKPFKSTNFIVHGIEMTNAEVLEKVIALKATLADRDVKYVVSCAINKATEQNNYMECANFLRTYRTLP